jgi:hypothetical protein
MRELSRDAFWKKPLSMIGVNGHDLTGQLAFARECCLVSDRGALAHSNKVHAIACEQNGAEGYGTVEADFLFCFIIQKQPAKIVQIGSGVSTSVILQASAVAGYTPQIICIDPYPTRFLRACAMAKTITLIAERAQDVPLECLIGGGVDFLFVDSTHTVKPGGEVNRIILDVLPRLKPGCYVHFHDINFPYDYQPDCLTTLFFWNETSLLHAFLIQNAHYRIAISLSMLHDRMSKELQTLLPGYRPAQMDHGLRLLDAHPFERHIPTSVYLEVLA